MVNTGKLSDQYLVFYQLLYYGSLVLCMVEKLKINVHLAMLKLLPTNFPHNQCYYIIFHNFEGGGPPQKCARFCHWLRKGGIFLAKKIILHNSDEGGA